MRSLVGVVVLTSVAACSKPKPDAELANALVDRARNPELRFVVKNSVYKYSSKVRRRFSGVVPASWDYDRVSEAFKAAGPGDGPGGSRISFGSSCESDPCIVGDFQAAIDAELLERFKVIGAKVLVDDRKPDSRLTITKDSVGRVVIDRYWWDDDHPSEYFTCIAVIMDAWLPAQPAFEKACELVTVEKLDPD